MLTKLKSFIAFIFIVYGAIGLTTPAFANENPVGYSVSAVLPENQINPRVSYFDLRVEPGKQQELQIEIHNHEPEELTVRLAVHNASTNSNGLVVYEEGEIDPSLTIPLTDLLKIDEEEVTVAAGRTKTVTAQLTVPQEEFEGIVLGGLHFEKAPEEDEETTGVQIDNRYAYVIGVQLSETDEPVEPEIVLGDVQPGLVNYRTAVVASLRYTAPVLVSDLSLSAKVFDEDGEMVNEKEQTDIRMAPNSKMDVNIDWVNRPLDPGTYQLEMTAMVGNQKWDWTEEFTIERAQARDINRDAVELEGENTPSWMSVGIVGLAAVVIVLLFYIRRLKLRVSTTSEQEE